jgi:hypothetical protein
MSLRFSKTVTFLNDLSRQVVNGMTSPSDGCSETANGQTVRCASVTHLPPDVTRSATVVGENGYIKYYYRYCGLRRFSFS